MLSWILASSRDIALLLEGPLRSDRGKVVPWIRGQAVFADGPRIVLSRFGPDSSTPCCPCIRAYVCTYANAHVCMYPTRADSRHSAGRVATPPARVLCSFQRKAVAECRKAGWEPRFSRGGMPAVVPAALARGLPGLVSPASGRFGPLPAKCRLRRRADSGGSKTIVRVSRRIVGLRRRGRLGQVQNEEHIDLGSNLISQAWKSWRRTKRTLLRQGPFMFPPVAFSGRWNRVVAVSSGPEAGSPRSSR